MGRHKFFTPEQELAICEMYERVERGRTVAEAFGTSDQTIYRILKRHGIPRTHRHPKPKKPKHLWDDSLTPRAIEMYEDGASYKDIGKELGYGSATVYKHLRAAGAIADGASRLTQKQVDEICRLYESGLSNAEIAKRLGIHHATASKVAKRNGCKLRGKGHIKPIESVCPRCGKKFQVTIVNQIYCSETCRSVASWHRRNDAMRAGEDVGEITLLETYERDNGRCYICGRKTDWNDYRIVRGFKVVGPNYPTRDHVIAIHNGGSHTWDNVRLACKSCNSKKSDRGQLRLAV